MMKLTCLAIASGTPLAAFGQASPGLGNIDPARMVQFRVRFSF
jgi:hypothetical protein